MSERTIAIIQARSTSSRLPGKDLLKLNGRYVIDRVVNAVQAVNVLQPGLLDEIVVAMPIGDRLFEHRFPKEVKLFMGAEKNVLDRYYKCALQYNADWILRITGDCPLLDPFLLYGLLTKQPRKQYQALAVNRGGIVDGQDAELFSFQELERVYKKKENEEHVSTAMRNAGSNKEDYGLPFNYKGLKYSLDTKDDYDRIQAYLEVLEGHT